MSMHILKFAARSARYPVCWSLLCLLLLGSGALDAQVAVIAHRDAPADTIASTRLPDLYTGDVQTWDGELSVVFFDLKPKTEVKRPQLQPPHLL